MRQAAALPLVAITAWDALERSRLTASDHILIHGGVGGDDALVQPSLKRILDIETDRLVRESANMTSRRVVGRADPISRWASGNPASTR